MVLGALVAFLILTIVGLPAWPYSARWSYGPSSAFGAIAVTLAILVVLGRL
jgi:hypothetical protein